MDLLPLQMMLHAMASKLRKKKKSKKDKGGKSKKSGGHKEEVTAKKKKKKKSKSKPSLASLALRVGDAPEVGTAAASAAAADR
jgi:hypothetical protein